MTYQLNLCQEASRRRNEILVSICIHTTIGRRK